MIDHWAAEARLSEQAAMLAVWAGDDWDDGIALCRKYIEPLDDAGNGRVLDIGCGIGRLLKPLALAWPEVQFIGLDPTIEMIRHAQASIVGDLPNVEYILGGCDELGEAAPIDVAYSVLTFQHLPLIDQRAYVAAIYQILDRPGRFSLQFVVDGEEGPLSHPVPVADMVEWCEEEGFRITHVHPVPEFPTWAWLTAVKR